MPTPKVMGTTGFESAETAQDLFLSRSGGGELILDLHKRLLGSLEAHDTGCRDGQKSFFR